MLIGKCETDLNALRELQLSPLRVFQNTQLTSEMQRLAARVAKNCVATPQSIRTASC